LNTLCGITTAPVLKDDGSIRIASGYDRESGLWCHDIPDLILPDRPTESDARDALQGLRHFFRTFPYADSDRTTEEFEIDGEKVSVEVVNLDQPPGLDESKFLVRIMTAVCRQSLELAPGLLVRAPEISGAGTGKGLGVKAACIIGSGAKPEAFTGGQDSEELDKRLTSALIQAGPTIFLDNHNAKQLQSDIIASALTENPIMVRPMGHSKMVPLHTRAFVAVTGNAVEISEDLARRFIVSNFDARVEDPESRKFKEGFIESVFADRATLLAEALTIWR